MLRVLSALSECLLDHPFDQEGGQGVLAEHVDGLNKRTGRPGDRQQQRIGLAGVGFDCPLANPRGDPTGRIRGHALGAAVETARGPFTPARLAIGDLGFGRGVIREALGEVRFEIRPGACPGWRPCARFAGQGSGELSCRAPFNGRAGQEEKVQQRLGIERRPTGREGQGKHLQRAAPGGGGGLAKGGQAACLQGAVEQCGIPVGAQHHGARQVIL